mmetsp:Transcript_45924/g.70277  ORF Transcript_45924/g.70277 Transcript_45924/m.70277 type:complete len:230 (-) Transcript_45924:96-785(-)|eukprot:CAMPEP_0117039428 /NCGR_PEP_ID=MMETSP0472-20121206/27672_1 /TAXON_ID=693140 ORGANISM="Tiarina fusus, Strain LIS" /NCGR_SAMPLE_ID=MMETSP0472 /ASSEMBLY_ACC=CAM_ASM_000603 /LENGTH=229 /DNA_ID=CAMNT_0004749915 /DNA_START=128 /DNA_END=817 /DNA_ORIENTATION=+
MSLYSYYFDYNNGEQAQGSSPQSKPSKSKSAELPDYNCAWSFLETPGLILSDTEDGSSCGGEDVRSYTWGKQETNTASQSWSGNYVQFEKVSVREYIRWVGDHPACYDAYPLCLGWAHGEETDYELDEYESRKTKKRQRGRVRGRRRPYLAKRLNAHTRKKLLEKEFSIDSDLQDGCEIGVECRLEMEPELADDRWGQASRIDSPLDDVDCGGGYSFPSSMIKVQILED